MTVFAAGTATATADPNNLYYIFKNVDGANPYDVYYVIMQIVNTVPSTSVAIEYRIGNR